MREIGQLAFGVVGGLLTGGAGWGIGLGMFVGGIAFAEKPKFRSNGAPTVDGAEVPFFGAEFYGTVGNVRPRVIGVGKDKKGQPAGIRVKRKTSGKKSGGQVSEKNSLTVLLFLASTHTTGPVYTDKIEQEEYDKRKTIYNRAGADDPKVAAEIAQLQARIAAADSIWEKAALQKRLNELADKATGYTLTPQFSGVTGALIAETSDVLRLYPGTAEQRPDSRMLELWPGLVSANRWSSCVMMNGLPIGPGGMPNFIFTVRSLMTGRQAILRAKMVESNIPAANRSLWAVEGDVEGAWVTAMQPPSEFMARIARRVNVEFGFDGVRVVAQDRAAPVIHEVEEKDVAARPASGAGADEQGDDPDADAPERTKRKDVRELVSEVRVPFQDIELLYEDNEAQPPPLNDNTSHLGATESYELPEADTMGNVVKFARALRDEKRTADRVWNVNMMPGKGHIMTGEVVRYTGRKNYLLPASPQNRQSRDYFILKAGLTPEGILQVEGEPWNARVYYQPGVMGTGARPGSFVTVPGAPIGFVSEAPAMFAAMFDTPGVLAAWAPADDETPEAIRFDPDDGDDRDILAPAIIGELLEELTPGDAFSYDWERVIRVKTFGDGVLQTGDGAKVRSGANTLLLDTGRVISFVSAQQVGPNVFELHGIKDGRYGSDAGLSGGTASVGTRCCLLVNHEGEADENVLWYPVKADWLNRSRVFKFRPPDDRDEVLGEEHTLILTGENLKPLAPTALRFARTPGGGAILSGRARTRYNDATGDPSWNSPGQGRLSDPLRFEVKFVDGVLSVKTSKIAADASFSFSWTAGELAALLGHVPGALRGTISQISDKVGPGRPAEFEE